MAANNINAINPDKDWQEVLFFSSFTVKHEKILCKADETTEGHAKRHIVAGVVSPCEEEYFITDLYYWCCITVLMT